LSSRAGSLWQIFVKINIWATMLIEVKTLEETLIKGHNTLSTKVFKHVDMAETIFEIL